MNRFWDPILRAIVEAAKPKTIVEVGTWTGLLTRRVLEYCETADAVLHTIDPAPQIDVADWTRRYGERLVIHEARSLNVLPKIHKPDVVLIDGDHNWFTVYHELKILQRAALSSGGMPPLIALHDVDWPYGRRDLYYDPESIPAAYRQPYEMRALSPDVEELTDEGMNAHLNNAIYEHAVKNGVRTAIEDFLADGEATWRTVYLHGFNGLGLMVTADRIASNRSLGRIIRFIESPAFLQTWIQEVELGRIRAHIREGGKARRLSREVERLESESARLEARLRESSALAERLDQTNAEIKQARETADAARERLQEKLEAATSQLNELHRVAKERAELATKVQELENASEQDLRAHQELQQRIQSMSRRLEELRSAADERDRLSKQVEELGATIERAEHTQADLSQSYERSQQEREQLCAELEAALSSVDELRARAAELELENRDLRTHNSDLGSQHDELTAVNASLRRELEGVAERLRVAQQAETQRQQLEQDVVEVQKRADRMHEKLSKEIERLQGQAAAAAAAEEDLLTRLSDMEVLADEAAERRRVAERRPAEADGNGTGIEAEGIAPTRYQPPRPG